MLRMSVLQTCWIMWKPLFMLTDMSQLDNWFYNCWSALKKCVCSDRDSQIFKDVLTVGSTNAYSGQHSSPHPTYSTDLPPTNLHLFRSLKVYLQGNCRKIGHWQDMVMYIFTKFWFLTINMFRENNVGHYLLLIDPLKW